MARKKREISPIGAYHVLLVGNKDLFLSDDDKDVFTDMCGRYFSKTQIYSLALCKRYIHLVFSDNGKGAASVIKPLATSYARYYNRTYKTEGRLFSDRFKSTAAADNEQLTDCVVYVDSTYGVPKTCSKADFFKNVCSRDEYQRRMNGRLERVCLDAYGEFSDKDILNLVCRLSGADVSAVESMTQREKRRLVKAASKHRWVSARRMSEAVGIPTANGEKADVSAENDTNGKSKELSVWLL